MSDANFKIPKSLREALVKGEVVPFVGAGASMTVRKKNDDGSESGESLFPSWKGFVELLADALRDENKPDEADYVLSSIRIKKPKYLDALQHAQEELGTGLWYKLFDESFDIPESNTHQASLKLNKLIWELSNNLIITTNVDRVFQWTCPQPSEFKLLDVQNVEYARLQNEKIPKRPTVWHLHGHIDHKEKVIFTRAQFESFYKQRDNDAKLQTLLSYLTQRTFLFIGFSLDDAYLREQLEYIHSIYKGGADSFYILLREKDIPTANLPEYVKPIPFSEFGKPLEDLLEELVGIAQSGDDKDNPNGDHPKPPVDSKTTEKKPFFNVPYNSKGAEFVGRKGKVDDIWEWLNRDGCASIGQAVSVKGFGGLGKTQLAVEYAHAYRDKYKNGVFWVVADESIDNQLLQIADKQKWINQYDKSVNQLDVAKKKFLELSDCLILFDNVEAYDDIKDYLPKLDSRTHGLFTSREKIYQFHQIDLELLERDESRELLLKISKRSPEDDTEKENLEQILETLGDIPLAIELVGGYLADREIITFAKYRQYLDEVPLDKLEKEFPEGSFTGHDRSIIQTLRISEKIINEKPLMVEILKILAWSGSSSMGISLLKALVKAETDFEFDTALGDAHKLRLVKKDENKERYAVHRLVAKVIRYENIIKINREWHEKLVINLLNWLNCQLENYNYLVEFESESEHLQEWLILTKKFLPEKSIDLYLYLGKMYFNLGDYEKALDYYLQVLETVRKLFGNNDVRVATALTSVSIIESYLNHHRKALDYDLEALNIHQELFGELNVNTANSFNNVGVTYGYLENYKESLKFHLQALDIRKKIFGDKNQSTLNSLYNVSQSYSKIGNHKAALRYKLKAHEIHIELLDFQDPNSILIVYDLINDYLKTGNIQKAGKLADEFLSYVPPDHPKRKFFEHQCSLYWKKAEKNKKRRRR